MLVCRSLRDEPADAQPTPRCSTDATGWTDARARRSPAGLGAWGAMIARMQGLVTGFQVLLKPNLNSGVSFTNCGHLRGRTTQHPAAPREQLVVWYRDRQCRCGLRLDHLRQSRPGERLGHGVPGLAPVRRQRRTAPGVSRPHGADAPLLGRRGYGPG